MLEREAANESNIFKMKTTATYMRLLKPSDFFVGTSEVFISFLFQAEFVNFGFCSVFVCLFVFVLVFVLWDFSCLFRL